MADHKALLHQLCDLEIPSVVKLSPDGQKVLYSTELSWGHHKGKHPVSTLWLASTGQTNSSRPLTSGFSKDYAPAWQPSGEFIAFISDRAKPGEKWALYTMQTVEGCEAHPITSVENERTIDAFMFSPDGKFIAFLSSDEKTAEQRTREENGEDVQVWGEDWVYARLRVVDLQTNQIRSLAIDRHVMGLCWSPDGKQIGIVSCETPNIEQPLLTGSNISVVDEGLSIVSNLGHFPNQLKDLTWADDERLYFRAGVPSSKGFCGHGVYAIDSNSPSRSCERVAFGIEDDAFSLTKANGEVIVEVQHRLQDQICLLSGEVLYSKKQELQAFDAVVAANVDKMVLVVATSDINHPVEVFTTTAGGGAMVQLSNHGRGLKDHQFGTCSFLSCLSTDNEVELDSLYLVPATHHNKTNDAAPSKPLPTVVMIHGGPTTRITNAFNTYYYMFSPYLLSLGYGVLIPNYRGSSGRGERFASYSIGGVGIYDYADVIDATRHAIDQGYADRDRIIVGGWSQGGFLTNLCCVRNGLHEYGWKFKAGISGAGICDIDAMALTSDLGSSFEAELHNGRVAWNMDHDDTQTRAASALWAINDTMKRSKQMGEMIIPPMLILHGANDPRCPISQSWGMRRALESYGLPFEFVTYPRQGHVFKEQKFWIDMAVRVGLWCDRYIGSGRACVDTNTSQPQ